MTAENKGGGAFEKSGGEKQGYFSFPSCFFQKNPYNNRRRYLRFNINKNQLRRCGEKERKEKWTEKYLIS